MTAQRVGSVAPPSSPAPPPAPPPGGLTGAAYPPRAGEPARVGGPAEEEVRGGEGSTKRGGEEQGEKGKGKRRGGGVVRTGWGEGQGGVGPGRRLAVEGRRARRPQFPPCASAGPSGPDRPPASVPPSTPHPDTSTTEMPNVKDRAARKEARTAEGASREPHAGHPRESASSAQGHRSRRFNCRLASAALTPDVWPLTPGSRSRPRRGRRGPGRPGSPRARGPRARTAPVPARRGCHGSPWTLHSWVSVRPATRGRC